MSKQRSRKVLTLEERVKVLKLLENGRSSRIVAEEMGVGRTQIQQINKRKAEVMEEYESNQNPERKRGRRMTGNEQINELCWEWFKDATARRIVVTGPLLKERALQFASDLGIETFKGSNGWLESFQKRHNVVFKTMSGERGDTDNKTVDDWKERLTELCEGYEAKDIFNLDETGLVYKDTGRQTFHIKGEDCAGGKRSKERITVALCTSMTGEKLKPVVIGKARKPRCFSNIKPESLPVTYRNNATSWMTSGIFEEWVLSIDKKMKREKRNILLFLDNAPTHPHLKLQNVTLKFFPPNTTCKLQPLDQGIIETLKKKYRKKQCRHVAAQMDKHKSMNGTELAKMITILDAIYWINSAWKEVEPSTITKCFARSGFKFNCEDDTVSDTEDDEEDVPLALLKMSRKLFGCEFQDLAEMDKDVATHDTKGIDWSQPATELLPQATNEGSDVDDTDDEGSVSDEDKVMTLAQFESCLMDMQKFAKKKGKCNLFSALMKVSDETVDLRLDQDCVKQSDIRGFFECM